MHSISIGNAHLLAVTQDALHSRGVLQEGGVWHNGLKYTLPPVCRKIYRCVKT